MSKKKISSDDFLRLMEDEENSSQPIAFAPKLSQSEDKVETQLRTNQRQSEDNQSTIGLQLDHKQTTEQSTIGLQLDHKQTTEQSTIGLQLDHKQTTEQNSNSELVYKQTTEQTTEQSTIGLQLDHKQTTNWHFSSLTGHERNFVIFVFQNCKNSGSLLSSPISNIQLREYLKTRSSSTVKTIIDRVIKKGLISKKPGKTGRGGWMVFEIKKSVFQDLLLGESVYKRSTIGLQTDNIWSTKQTTEQTTSAPYSSSNNLNINTNTIELPENLRRFGISVVNLQNLVTSGKTTQEVIERSLAALSFDVENGKTGNLANIIFGVLGTGREYISQKYAEALSKELDFEFKRLKEIEVHQKELAEMRLKAHYEEFLKTTPDYLVEVQKRHGGLLQASSELLNRVAFEEFKTNLENKQGDL